MIGKLNSPSVVLPAMVFCTSIKRMARKSERCCAGFVWKFGGVGFGWFSSTASTSFRESPSSFALVILMKNRGSWPHFRRLLGGSTVKRKIIMMKKWWLIHYMHIFLSCHVFIIFISLDWIHEHLTFNNNIEIHEKFGRLYQFQRKWSVSLDWIHEHLCFNDIMKKWWKGNEWGKF